MARYDRVGEQIEDDAGQPLVSGKLYFFNSGTNTAKTTYADINNSIPNPNPVILSASGRVPNIFFNGSARVMLTDKDDVQIEVKDPIGGTAEEGVFSPWNPLTIYNESDIVIGSDGNFYVSIGNGNQDNDPTTSPQFWTQVRFIRVWNPNETYSALQIVEGSDGLLYSSVTDNNLNNDPALNTTQWKPAVTVDIPAVVLAAGYSYAYNNF